MNSIPELSFKSYGSGNNYVVFLHGYCEVKEMWDDFILLFSELFKTHTFICIDLPGFGKSDFQEDISSLSDVADAISGFLKSKKINRALWVGHSLGGYIIMNLLTKNRNLIDGICFFHSSIFSDSEEKKLQRNKTIKFIEDQGKEAFIKNFIPNLFYTKRKEQLMEEIDRSIYQAEQNSKSSMIKYMKMMRDRPDLSSELKKLDLPVHFISGKNDSSVPLNISERQIDLIANSTSLMLEECGHMGMFEKEKESSLTIINFIKSIY